MTHHPISHGVHTPLSSLDGSRHQHAFRITGEFAFQKVAFPPTSTQAYTIINSVYYRWPVKFQIPCAAHAHFPPLTLTETTLYVLWP